MVTSGGRLETFPVQRRYAVPPNLHTRVYEMLLGIPHQNEGTSNVAEAFEKIVVERMPNMPQSDKGTEFLNSTFQSMLR